MRSSPKSGEASGAGSFEPVVRLCRRRPGAAAVVALSAICAVIFGDVVFAPGDMVLSREGTDIYLQFSHWRAFGFGHLRNGDLPLWNPHVFSGTTFIGAFQSALFYPVSWMHLLLGTAHGINIELVGHLILLGSGMYFWSSRVCVSRVAPIVGAVAAMFSAPIYLRVFAGHMTMLAAVAWMPFVMLAIDALFTPKPLRGLFGGVLAIGLQILAGHPQTVYYTGITSAAYLGIRMAENRGGTINILLWALMYAGGVLVSAVQLLPGLAAATASSRGGGGLTFREATFFSFPPENLLTFLTPWYFGSDMPDLHENTMYWGRGYFWEMNMYSGLCMAILALMAVRHERRLRVIGCVVVAAVALVAALGSATPFYRVLYSLLPGLSMFRGPCKSLIVYSLFSAYLASLGTDALLRGLVRPRIPGIASLVLSAPMWLAGVLLLSDQGARGRFLILPVINFARGSGQAMVGSEVYDDGNFLFGASLCAGAGLLISALFVSICGALLLLSRRRGFLKWGAPAVAAFEMIFFAQLARPAWDLSGALEPKTLTEFRDRADGDYRIKLRVAEANAAMSAGMYNISGYDPQVDYEYSEFLAELSDVGPRIAPKWLAMLRCRYLFNFTPTGFRVADNGGSLGRAIVISDARVIADRKMTYAVMRESSFDPSSSVILDRPPEHAPSPGARGTATLISETTDKLTFSVEADAPAVLLVTDAFAPGWKAWSTDTSGRKEKHEILRGNRILRAIPIPAGKRTLVMEYRPAAFTAGLWITLVSVPLLTGARVFLTLRGRRAAAPSATA